MGHMSKDCRSQETSAFEAGEEGLAETGRVDMESIDLNALEIGAVQLLEKDHKTRIGIDSCAAVTVFPNTVADDDPFLQAPGKAMSFRQASAGSWCAKGAGQAQRQVSSVREPDSGGHTRSFDGGVRDERHETRHVLPQERQGIKAYSYHEGSGTKLELERANGVFELSIAHLDGEIFEKSLVGHPTKGTQHRWIVGKLANDVIMCGVQTLVVNPDQEASITNVENSLMR